MVAYNVDQALYLFLPYFSPHLKTTFKMIDREKLPDFFRPEVRKTGTFPSWSYWCLLGACGHPFSSFPQAWDMELECAFIHLCSFPVTYSGIVDCIAGLQYKCPEVVSIFLIQRLRWELRPRKPCKGESIHHQHYSSLDLCGQWMYGDFGRYLLVRPIYHKISSWNSSHY